MGIKGKKDYFCKLSGWNVPVAKGSYFEDGSISRIPDILNLVNELTIETSSSESLKYQLYVMNSNDLSHVRLFRTSKGTTRPVSETQAQNMPSFPDGYCILHIA